MPRGQWRQPVRINAHPLVKQLFEIQEKQGIMNKTLCADAGVATFCLSDWRRRGDPSLRNLEACLNALGFSIVAVPTELLDELEGLLASYEQRNTALEEKSNAQIQA